MSAQCGYPSMGATLDLALLRKETMRPSDASDIHDLESARKEVRRLRKITKQIRFTKQIPRSFIFLDIDGVVHPLNAKHIPAKADYDAWLNRAQSAPVTEVIDGEFLPEHMALVKKIANETGAQIVLSSTWRETPEDLAAVKKQFELHGLPKLVGCTPRAACRAAEICIWLEEKFGVNAVDTCCFVALDDDDLIARAKSKEGNDKYGRILAAGHFVKLDPAKALTPKDTQQAIRLLHVQQKMQRGRVSASKAKQTASTLAVAEKNILKETNIDLSRLDGPAKLLLERQRTKLPSALAGLKRHRRKVGHWAWWCFPTELKGRSEPRPQTCVTTSTAAALAHHSPKVWRELLETICDLAEDSRVGKSVLPRIDHGRVTFFLKFWGNLPKGVTPSWLLSVLQRLEPFFGGTKK